MILDSSVASLPQNDKRAEPNLAISHNACL